MLMRPTFTSTVTGETYIINYRFDCNERCLVYLLTCNKCKTQYVGQPIDQFRSRWNNYKSDSRKVRELHVCNSICLTIFLPLVNAVSQRMSHQLLKIKLTYLIHLKGKTIAEAHLRPWHHLGLIQKKVSSSFITNILSIFILIGLVRFEEKNF